LNQILTSSTATETLTGLDACALHRARVLARCPGVPGFANSGIQTWVTSGCRFGESKLDSDDIRVYPNPASEWVVVDLNSLETEVTSIEVYDVTGQLMQTAQTADNGSITISLDNFADGMYNLIIRGEDMMISRQIAVH
jgi:hypothetical protein